MPFLSKDQISVEFNGSGILAESATLNSEATLQSVNAINRKGFIGVTPNGPITSQFAISYPIEGNDPILNYVSFLRTGYNNTTFDSQRISFGGVTGNVYLSNYSLNLLPNKIIRGNANFVSYEPLSGFLQQKSPSLPFNSLNGTGLLHSDSSLTTNTSHFSTYPIYEMGYTFNTVWKPIYSFGNKIPIQVNLYGGKEEFVAVKNYYTGVSMSGLSATGILLQNTDSLVTLNELSTLVNGTSYSNFALNLSSAVHHGTKMQEDNGVIKVILTAENEF